MKGNVLAFANQKGGVGKTTFTLQTAHVAIERGLKVLVIDMDGQGNASMKLASNEQLENQELTKSFELFNPGTEITVTKGESGIDLIPANTNDHILYAKEAEPIENIVHPGQNIQNLRKEYDLILIDCPPSLGRLLLSCLAMSDSIVIPVAVSGFAITGVNGIIEVMNKVKESLNPDLKLTGILVNNYNSRSKEDKESVKELKTHLGNLVLEQVVSRRAPIDKAINRSLPVWKIRSGSASQAAKEIRAAANEIMERIGV